MTKIQKKKSISLFYAYFMAWKNFKFSKENVNIQSVNMSPWCQSKTNSSETSNAITLYTHVVGVLKTKWGRASKVTQLEKALATIPGHLSLR